MNRANIGIKEAATLTVVSVSVCQAGYDTNGLKTAVAVVAGGLLTDTGYQIIRTADGAMAGSGSMTVYYPVGWTRCETYYKIDFSDFAADGNYRIRTNGVESCQFIISDNIWQSYVDEMIGYYRIQRCGVDTHSALPPEGFPNRPGSEALHGPCHMDDARVISPTGCIADCTGGWHDAGDNNKYNSQFGWLAAAFVSTYYRYPEAVFDFDSNGVPDLLDEARIAAEYLLKVQKASNNNGGLLDLLQNYTNAYIWLYPTDEADRVLCQRPSTVGKFPSAYPYDTAMKAAAGLAAVSRAFTDIDPQFAQDCREGANSAYNWALDNTANTGGAYCTKPPEASRLLAAVELFLLTGDSIFGDYVNKYIDEHSSISSRGTNYWGAEPLALADYYPAAGEKQEKIVGLLTDAVRPWMENLAEPFGVSKDLLQSEFGINESNMSKAADAYRLYEITGNTLFRDAAVKAMEWTFGVNPFDISFVIGIGSKYPRYPHSRLDADAETNPQSTIYLPGFMLSGPLAHDTLDENSASPWYMDRPLPEDGLQQWRYNEHSVSIQYACLDLIVGRAYKKNKAGGEDL